MAVFLAVQHRGWLHSEHSPSEILTLQPDAPTNPSNSEHKVLIKVVTLDQLVRSPSQRG